MVIITHHGFAVDGLWGHNLDNDLPVASICFLRDPQECAGMVNSFGKNGVVPARDLGFSIACCIITGSTDDEPEALHPPDESNRNDIFPRRRLELMAVQPRVNALEGIARRQDGNVNEFQLHHGW